MWKKYMMFLSQEYSDKIGQGKVFGASFKNVLKVQGLSFLQQNSCRTEPHHPQLDNA